MLTYDDDGHNVMIIAHPTQFYSALKEVATLFFLMSSTNQLFRFCGDFNDISQYQTHNQSLFSHRFKRWPLMVVSYFKRPFNDHFINTWEFNQVQYFQIEACLMVGIILLITTKSLVRLLSYTYHSLFNKTLKMFKLFFNILVFYKKQEIPIILHNT